MYSTKQSLSVENMSDQPKKESLLQSVYRSVTSLVGDHLTRGTGALMKNWSSMNSPLSVTVVSPDLLKSLQQGKEQQLVNPSDAFYTAKMWSRDSQNGVGDRPFPNILYSNTSDSATTVKKCNSDSSDSEKRWREYKGMYVDCNGTAEKDSDKTALQSSVSNIVEDNKGK